MLKKQRFSVHGVAMQENKILLITEKKGPYGGLLNFPGGGIEFGETPEETLRREFQEEVGMAFSTLHLLDNVSHTQEVLDARDPFLFHHVDLIYQVTDCRVLQAAAPQEMFSWYELKSLKEEMVTPFVRKIILQK